MCAESNDSDLLQIQVATLIALTDDGRILHENDPDHSIGPRLFLAGCDSGNVVHVRHDVSQRTLLTIHALVADEPPLNDPDVTPLHLDDYVRLLAAEAPLEEQRAGSTYHFPDHFEYEHDVELVSSDTPDGDRLFARLEDQRMPEVLVSVGFVKAAEIWAPWSISLLQGEIESIAMTARIGPAGAEVGVTTVPALRGRGFAAAATAGWATLPSLNQRALFYSMDRTNFSSRRVAERLGLRFIGASFRFT